MNEIWNVLKSDKWKERIPRILEANTAFQAAVLVPLLIRDGRLEVLFEVRSPHLRRQPNEICFPGGKVEADDRFPVQTALREIEEELYVPRESIDILGALDIVKTPIGAMVYPYVGKLKEERLPSFSTQEVAEVFTVPFSWFLEHEPYEAPMQAGTQAKEGFPYEKIPYYSKGWKVRYSYSVWIYEYENRVIWGLTAGIVKNFVEIYRDIFYNNDKEY